MKIEKLSQKALNKTAKILNDGGVVVFPTDTVYGFLADAGNKKAVNTIYKIKKRPKSKPLAVFVPSIKAAKELAEISKDQEAILRKKWPGPYTFVLKSKAQNPKPETIALRVPSHKFLLALLKKFGKPAAQTSVNISGQPELNKISDIIKMLENLVRPELTRNLLVIDGGSLPKRKPSKVIDLTGKTLTIIR